MIVLVGSLAHHFRGFFCDAFPVNHDWRGGLDINKFLCPYPVFYNLKVELAHAVHQVLARLFINLDLDSRVFLADHSEHFNQLWQVAWPFSLNCLCDNRLKNMGNLLERVSGVLCYRFSHIRFNAGYPYNVASRDIVDNLPFCTVIDKHLLDS